MKHWKPVAIGILSIGIATLLYSLRSVRPDVEGQAPLPFVENGHAAGLFVGVSRFDQGGIVDVPYAVDDAIDLAWVCALGKEAHLLDAKRAVLALSGEPVKDESKQRLRELRDAGARVESADRNKLGDLLEEQASRAGKSGMLIVSFATHGVMRDGVPHVVAACSKELSTAKITDVIDAHGVPRSLIFIDACRERSSAVSSRAAKTVEGSPADGTSSAPPAGDPSTSLGMTRGVSVHASRVMPLISGLPHSRGRVMLSAVDTAFDDPARRNGVLTAAVIDGLRCGATYPRGWITGQTLAEYVEHNVRAWIVKNRNREVASAIQISIDGQARNMRLVKCWGDDFPMAPAFDGSKLYAYSPDRSKLLWQTDLGSPITGAQQAKAEIVASTADELLAFDREGNRIWSVNEGTPLHAFAVVDLHHKHKLQVVALWGSRVAIYDAGSGRLRATHDYPQPLERVAIYQPTKRHNPKIVVAATNRIFCIDSKAMPVWSGRFTHAVASLAFRDADADAKCDIAVTTSGGNTILLDARGHVIGRHSGREFVLDRHLK